MSTKHELRYIVDLNCFLCEPKWGAKEGNYFVNMPVFCQKNARFPPKRMKTGHKNQKEIKLQVLVKV